MEEGQRCWASIAQVPQTVGWGCVTGFIICEFAITQRKDQPPCTPPTVEARPPRMFQLLGFVDLCITPIARGIAPIAKCVTPVTKGQQVYMHMRWLKKMEEGPQIFWGVQEDKL